MARGRGSGLASNILQGMPGPWVLQGFLRTPVSDGALSSDTCALLSLPRAISCMLEIWLDYFQDEFCQLPEFPSLRMILEFMRQSMPGSAVELRARRYLQQFRRLQQRSQRGWPSGDRGCPADPASMQLGREQGVGSHPTPRAVGWGHLPGLLPPHMWSSGKSGLDLGGTWTVCPDGDTLSSWSYSFGPSKTP